MFEEEAPINQSGFSSHRSVNISWYWKPLEANTTFCTNYLLWDCFINMDIVIDRGQSYFLYFAFCMLSW